MNNESVMRVVLAYPASFTNVDYCMNKVSRLVQRFERFVLVYVGGNPDMARQCAKQLGCEIELNEAGVSLEGMQATHAIIFDDGGGGVADQCDWHGIPYRRIPVSLTTVANVDKGESCDVYIGRGSAFGNPYAVGVDGDRDEVIRKFEYDFHRGLLTDRATGVDLKELALQQLKGKRLGCHCKPAACHGEVIAQFVNRHG